MKRLRPHLWLAWLLAVTLAPGSAQDAFPPEIPAGELVRLTVQNEVRAADQEPLKHFFRSRRQTPKGSQTRLYVETNQAMAGMLVAVNDRPLPPEQRQAEINHLNWLAGDADALRKKRAHEKDDADRTLRIVKALPEAFRYDYAGSENGTADLGEPGSQLVRLKFGPNPSYSPPSRVEQVLAGMNGYLLIDAQARRFARIDGTLFRDVSFGWGLVGHLDKGGHFRVQQADVGEGNWEITEMSLSLTGKILLFKSLNMISEEVFSDFRPVTPHLTFAQGADLLKVEEEKLARSGSPGTTP